MGHILGFFPARNRDDINVTLEEAIRVLVIGPGRQFPALTTAGLRALLHNDDDNAFRRLLPERLAANTVGARWHRQHLTETVQSLCSKALRTLDSE